jgi:hypothetical protein
MECVSSVELNRVGGTFKMNPERSA